MKKVLFAAISLCIAAALTAAPLTTLAEEASAPKYPEIEDSVLSFTALSDYAVASDTLHAFAEGNIIKKLDGENITEYSFYDGESSIPVNISGLDYQKNGDDEGDFYFTLSNSSTVYVLPDSPSDDPAIAENVKLQNNLSVNDFGNEEYSYRITAGVLYIWHGNSQTDYYGDGECSHLKIYNDKLYIKNGNFICEIDGADVNERTGENGFRFSNYDLLKSVPTGDAAQLLNSAYTPSPMVILIDSNGGQTVYATKVDLNKLTENSEYFTVDNPKLDTCTDLSARSGGMAMLLCKTGDISLVAVGKDCYMLSSEHIGDFQTTLKLDEDFVGNIKTTVTLGDYAHSLPYVSNATRLFKISPDEEVTVVDRYLKAENPQLAHDFYVVKNDKGDEGYVAAELFGGDFPEFDEGTTSPLPERNPNYSDHIRTVVLVLVVVALALVGIGYITWVATAKHPAKPANDSDDENDKPGNINNNYKE